MPTDPLTAVNGSTSTAPTGVTSQGTAGMLGKDDFLKLLIGQMQNQDPLNPTDSSQYMGQLTQFSILEQVTNLSKTNEAASANDYDAQAIALIGKTVDYAKADGSAASGVVQHVTFSKEGPALTIDGAEGIPPVAVTKVS